MSQQDIDKNQILSEEEEEGNNNFEAPFEEKQEKETKQKEQIENQKNEEIQIEQEKDMDEKYDQEEQQEKNFDEEEPIKEKQEIMQPKISEEQNIESKDLMTATGHREEEGMFLDKRIVFNNQKKEKKIIKTQKKNNIICQNNSMLQTVRNILAAKVVISPKTFIRSDLCMIKIEFYSIICDNVIIKPPLTQQFTNFTSITIGKYSIIGPNSIVKANIIGNCVRIGKNCVLEDNVVVEDNCIVEDNSIVPENMTIPKNTIYGGKPARFIKRTPVTTQQDHMIEAINYYQSALERFNQQEEDLKLQVVQIKLIF